METPEGKVKRKLKAHLKNKCGKDLYYHMSVQAGYGKATLDFLCFYRSFGFAIETKAPRGKLTLRQENTRKEIERSGVPVFVIDGEDKYGPLDKFLQDIDKWHTKTNQNEQ